MNLKQCGLFIKQLREDKNLSQDDLANAMHMDRSNISRWENGKAQIPTDKLKTLSEIFDITVDEIIAGERTTTKNRKEHSNIMLEFLEEKDTSIKKFKFISVLTFVVLILSVFSFLIYYFIQTHNTERVYKITGSSVNYEILNGVLFVTREQSYLKIGGISDSIIDVELYYKDNNKDKIIFKGNSDNIIVDFTGYNHGIDVKNIDKIKDNLYLKVDNEEMKLILSEQYVNKNYVLEDLTTVVTYSTTSEKKIPKKIEDNFKCDSSNCILMNNSLDIRYDIDSSILYINDLNGNFMIDYHYGSNTFNFISEKLNYFVQNNDMTCNSKNCDNYKETYDKYYTNLIKKYVD